MKSIRKVYRKTIEDVKSTADAFKFLGELFLNFGIVVVHQLIPAVIMFGVVLIFVEIPAGLPSLGYFVSFGVIQIVWMAFWIPFLYNMLPFWSGKDKE